jgi:hypothetical protein
MTLHWEAVPSPLQALLRQLMELEVLNPFALAGRTALALRFGHRQSIDLDLFTTDNFSAEEITDELVARIGFGHAAVTTNSISGSVDGIKIDLLAHRYGAISPVEVIKGVRLHSIADNAAMKLNAMANRGSKKDFWDIRELLAHFTKNQLLGFFAQKYPHASVWGVEKSPVYFEDAEGDPDPVDLRQRSWSEIKQAILSAVQMS